MLRRPLLIQFIMILLWWCLYALVFAGQIVQMSAQSGVALSWQFALTHSFAGWLSWVPLTMFLLWVVRRYPLEENLYWQSITAHMLAVLIAIVMRAIYVYLTNPWFGWYPQLPSPLTVLQQSAINNFFLGWLVVAAGYALFFSEKARHREQQLTSLQTQLTQARLHVLTAQLNPHFLFNALNSIAELIHRKPKLADEMLVAFSDLLRKSLAAPDHSMVSLHEQIAFTRDYLAIEQIRLDDRLTVHWLIEPRCRQAMAPALLLQPLAENALIHAIAKRIAPGVLCIRARCIDAQLQIQVINDGPNVTRGVSGNGLALQNIRQRLNLMYGSAASLEMQPQPDGGMCVQVTIPFSEQVHD